MIFRLLILLIANVLIVISCSQAPEIVIDEIVDLSYDELKQQYITCKGKGVMTAQGKLPWKLRFFCAVSTLFTNIDISSLSSFLAFSNFESVLHNLVL